MAFDLIFGLTRFQQSRLIAKSLLSIKKEQVFEPVVYKVNSNLDKKWERQ